MKKATVNLNFISLAFPGQRDHIYKAAIVFEKLKLLLYYPVLDCINNKMHNNFSGEVMTFAVRCDSVFICTEKVKPVLVKYAHILYINADLDVS